MATFQNEGPLSIEQEVLDPEWGSARTLAPAIARLLDRHGLAPGSLHAIGVVQGPGSFTGLRVGVATAKTMAWALGIPLVAVDALDCVACQVARTLDRSRLETRPSILAVADAFRGQVFWSEYRWCDGEIAIERATEIEDRETVASRCLARRERLILTGPGVARIRHGLPEVGSEAARSEAAGLAVEFIEGPAAVPMAAMVAELAWKRWERGQTEDVLGLLPKYYRGSAAEEKKKGGGSV